MPEFLPHMEAIAREAGALLMRYFRQRIGYEYKGEVDLVTRADRESEQLIADFIRRQWPQHDLVGEEGARRETGSDYRWYIDPLDGTTNFAHGFPFFAVSIALVENGMPLVGVVYAPMLDELFCATKNGGAWLNGHSIRVAGTHRLIESLIGTGFSYLRHQTLPKVMRQLETVLAQVRDVRRAGAAALDLAYVACGRLDGFYEIDLQPWDTAAGWLLVEEAGGKVTNLSGGEFSPFMPAILASNNKLHQSLLQLLQ